MWCCTIPVYPDLTASAVKSFFFIKRWFFFFSVNILWHFWRNFWCGLKGNKCQSLILISTKVSYIFFNYRHHAVSVSGNMNNRNIHYDIVFCSEPRYEKCGIHCITFDWLTRFWTKTENESSWRAYYYRQAWSGHYYPGHLSRSHVTHITLTLLNPRAENAYFCHRLDKRVSLSIVCHNFHIESSCIYWKMCC